MDNNNSIRFEHTPYHNVYLKDRKNIELTGVKNIESFDSLEFNWNIIRFFKYYGDRIIVDKVRPRKMWG